MMFTVDRNDPDVRAAMDEAARVAEHLLEAHNSDAMQEHALDVLNEYVQFGLTGCRRRLAWAFALTERRTDLKPHEEKLLDLAWERVREDAIQAEWQEMGRG